MARRALAVLALIVGLTLVLSTSGVSAMEADRSLTVRVVDTEDAYVGVVACQHQESGAENSGNPVTVQLTNRLSEPLDGARVTGLDDGGTVPRQDASTAFDSFVWPGETDTATLTFESAVDHVRVETHTADGSASVETRVAVHPQSHPDC